MPLVSPKHSVTASICDSYRGIAHTDTLSVHFSPSYGDGSNAHVISVLVWTSYAILDDHSHVITVMRFVL